MYLQQTTWYISHICYYVLFCFKYNTMMTYIESKYPSQYIRSMYCYLYYNTGSSSVASVFVCAYVCLQTPPRPLEVFTYFLVGRFISYPI